MFFIVIGIILLFILILGLVSIIKNKNQFLEYRFHNNEIDFKDVDFKKHRRNILNEK